MAFDNIRLEKGMYQQAGKSFTQVLEGLDPSENYKGSALENTDAFQRQLKRFSIRCKGAGSDPVEKFFSTAQSAVLFPEFIARTVRQGMEGDDILSALVATTTNIDAMDYRTIYAKTEGDELDLCRVGEGASIPATHINTSDHLVKLYKRGRMLVASYEALRFQKLDLFSVMLRQIGNHIQQMHTADALEVVCFGDGNGNSSTTYSVTDNAFAGKSGTFSYTDLVKLWTMFTPYTLNTIVVTPHTASRVLVLPEMRDAAAGLRFHGTGELVTPVGAQLLCTNALSLNNTLVCLDNRCTLEMVQAGGVNVEFDKLIDRQLERAAITSITGFAKINQDSCKMLSI